MKQIYGKIMILQIVKQENKKLISSMPFNEHK